MNDITQAATAKAPKVAVAIRDWIDINGNPVESGKEVDAVGFRYTHLPTARKVNPAFNPETDKPDASAVFEHVVGEAGKAETMLGIFGGLTLAGNVVNTATNGPKGDPNLNPVPLIAARFTELATGIWADRSSGGGIRYDAEKLAQAIANAKGETDPAPYAAKMAGKVDPKTGAAVAADSKGAISYGAYALRNATVKAAYDTLTGGGSNIAAL